MSTAPSPILNPRQFAGQYLGAVKAIGNHVLDDIWHQGAKRVLPANKSEDMFGSLSFAPSEINQARRFVTSKHQKAAGNF